MQTLEPIANLNGKTDIYQIANKFSLLSDSYSDIRTAEQNEPSEDRRGYTRETSEDRRGYTRET